MPRSSFQTVALVLTIFTILAGKVSATEVEILYKGPPPSGDIYYTAVMASGEIDGTDGEELIITDDYGSFKILDWDTQTRTFHQKWLSDPIFQTNRVKRIFVPNTRPGYDVFIIFLDSSNNLIIYKWLDYIVVREPTIYSSRNPDITDYDDFVIGEFAPGYRGWEIALVMSRNLNFTGNPFNLGYLKIGNFKPKLQTILSRMVLNLGDNPGLNIVCGFDGSQGLVIMPKAESGQKSCRILYTAPPFNEYMEYFFACKKGEKIGWTGMIQNGGTSYVSTYVREEKGNSLIKFYSVSQRLKYSFAISVPDNVSSWVMSDVDADGTRELVILDFMGILHVYKLNSLLNAKGR